MIGLESDEVKNKVMSYGLNERNYMAVVTEGLNNADVLGIDKGRRAIEFEIKVSRSDLQKELAAIRYASLEMSGRGLAPATEDQPEQLALNVELGNLKKKAGGWSKIVKHEEYIDPVKYAQKRRSYYASERYVPNTFYFVVPEKLVQLAIEGTQGTNYGVIAYDGCRQKDQHYGYFYNGIWYDRYADDRPDGAIWRKGVPCSDTCYKEIAVRKKARKIHDSPVEDSVINAMLSRAVWENVNMHRELIGKTAIVAEQRAEIKQLKEELETCRSSTKSSPQ